MVFHQFDHSCFTGFADGFFENQQILCNPWDTLDLRVVNVDTAEKAAEICQNTENCRGWTWFTEDQDYRHPASNRIIQLNAVHEGEVRMCSHPKGLTTTEGCISGYGTGLVKIPGQEQPLLE